MVVVPGDDVERHALEIAAAEAVLKGLLKPGVVLVLDSAVVEVVAHGQDELEGLLAGEVVHGVGDVLLASLDARWIRLVVEFVTKG